MNIIQAQKNCGSGNHFVFLPERERERERERVNIVPENIHQSAILN
jgi:hypothetical protein